MNEEKMKEIFNDAENLYQEAIKEFGEGKVRDAAEKAWGATLRATNALILVRAGKEIEGAIGTTKELHILAIKDKEIDEKLVGRYHTREGYLHGHCFYMGICEPIEDIERRIRETDRYLKDAMELAGANFT